MGRPGTRYPAKMNRRTPTRIQVLGKGHAGPSLGEGPQDLACFPTKCDAGSRPELEARAREEGQERVHRGVTGSPWRGPLALALPRRGGRGVHCPEDDLAIMICTKAGVFSGHSRPGMPVRHGPGPLAPRPSCSSSQECPPGVGTGRRRGAKNNSYLTHFA